MKRFKKLAMMALVALAACSSGGDPDDPDPVITYILQVLTAPPTSATINTTVPVSFKILKQEDGGPTSPASGIAIGLAVTAGGGMVNDAASATVTTGTDGSAAFTWKMGSTPGTQTIQATAPGEVTPVNVSMTATALPATALTITTQPATQSTTGAVLSRQPAIQLRNSAGAAVAQAGVVVSATVQSGPGALGGSATAATDANGVATFTNLSLTGAGSTVLRFTASLEGTTVGVNSDAVVVIPPNQLALTVAPSGLTSGVPFFQQPTVQLQNGLGAPISQAGVVVTASTTAVTAVLGVAVGGIGSLTATTDANGLATFHDLMLSGSGGAALKFTATGFTEVNSAVLTLDAGTITVLNNGPASSAMTGSTGSLNYFTFTAPTGTSEMSFATLDGTGSVEILARRGAWPTASDFTCRDQGAGITHLCDITSNRDGAWFVIVRGTAAYTGVTLRGYAYGPECAPRTITTGGPMTGPLAGTTCRVNGSARVVERFTWTVAATTAVRFSLNTTVTGAYVTYKRANEARTFQPLTPSFQTGGVNLFPPGTYQVEVLEGVGAAALPAYTLTINPIVPAAPVAGACTAALSSLAAHMSGLNIPLTLTAGDCAGTTAGTQSHRIVVILGPGQTLTATAASTAFDPYLKVMAGQVVVGAAPFLVEDDNSGGGTTARVVYTNTGVLNFFTVEVAPKTAGGLGAYTFTYDASGAYYNIIAGLKVFK